MQQRRQALLAELGRAFWRLPALRLAVLGEAPGRSLPAALARGLHLVAGSLAHLELEAPQLATLDWVASAHAAPARCYHALPRCAARAERVQLQALQPELQCCASTAARKVLAGLNTPQACKHH